MDSDVVIVLCGVCGVDSDVVNVLCGVCGVESDVVAQQRSSASG